MLIFVDIMKDLIIVIPIYKDNFENFELVSLKQTFNLLSHYNITFICPEDLNIQFLNHYDFIKDYKVERFEKVFFKNIDGYNRLLMDYKFYERFNSYQFMLICQTDVYVFRDDLLLWLNNDYDYVGAPWLVSKFKISSLFEKYLKVYNKFRKLINKKEKDYSRIFYKVGNGGFSLRKIKTFENIAREEYSNIINILEKKDDYYIEDVFWSLYIPTKWGNFSIPHWKEAINFCIDRKPKLGLKLNNNQLPMACHGFNKKKVKNFWKTKFEF